MKTRLVVYTSTRAEYGLLRTLVDKLINESQFDVRLFVTGTHLSEKFGFTVKEIEADFPHNIYYRVIHNLEESSALKTLPIMADALVKYGCALTADKPDFALVLGDRYEALCFGLVCASLNIPLVHLHGGELTFGALDDKFRHALTKLSDWHFVACEEYRKRVVQLGEHPETVFNVGALGVDNALHLPLKSRYDISKTLNLNESDEFYVCTFHPETNSSDYGAGLLKALLEKIEIGLLSKSNVKVIITGVNNDAGSAEIKKEISIFVEKNKKSVLFYESLGVLNYLSLVKESEAVLGNSSSGILEAHSLGMPAINIGLRQEGRVCESSCFDFPKIEDIERLSFDDIRKVKQSLKTADKQSLFGSGDASRKMLNQLLLIAENLKSRKGNNKTFYDLN